MMRLVHTYWPSWLAFAVGATFAVLLTPLILATMEWYQLWYAAQNPPATLRWHSMERLDADTLRFRLWIKQERDCEMLRLGAMTGSSVDNMRVGDVALEDGRVPQSFPVGITVQSRPWILRGIYGDLVTVTAYYGCGEHVIKAPLLVGTMPARVTP